MNNEQKKTNRRESLFRFRKWPVYQAAKSFRKRIKELAKRLPESEDIFYGIKFHGLLIRFA